MEYYETLILAIPAFVANMMPVITAKMRIAEKLNSPIDGGRTIKNKRILGNNKTWRGLVSAVMGACVVSVIQYLWYSITASAQSDLWIYSSIARAIFFGSITGVLVIAGDAMGSVIKRQLNIQSGRPFIPLDQTDYMILFLAGTNFIVSWSGNQVVFLLVFALLANTLSNITAYALGIKNTYW